MLQLLFYTALSLLTIAPAKTTSGLLSGIENIRKILTKAAEPEEKMGYPLGSVIWKATDPELSIYFGAEASERFYQRYAIIKTADRRAEIIYYRDQERRLRKELYVQPKNHEKNLSRLRFHSDTRVVLDPNGDLLVAGQGGYYRHSAPVAWQRLGSRRVLCHAAYEIINAHTVGYRVLGYDSRYPLVIDPTITWNTFAGGSGDEQVRDMTLDSSNSMVLVGSGVFSWGSPRRAYTLGWDAFVVQFDNSGQLTWNTFLGGTDWDEALGVALGPNQEKIIAGFSSASWGTPLQNFSANFDGWVANLDADGYLAWHTFLGGSGSDYYTSIGVNSLGQIIAGGSSDVSWGSPLHAFQGGTDGWVARLDLSGALQWTTFVGGAGTDLITALGIGPGAEFVGVGKADAGWGTPIRNHSGGMNDLSIFKMDTSGNLLWHTFLGGMGEENIVAIAYASGEDILLSGSSTLSWGSPLQAFGPGNEAFLAKLSSQGDMLWHTFIPNAGEIATDSYGRIYSAGIALASWGTPLMPFQGQTDGSLAVYNSNGDLLWNAFIGGADNDHLTGIRVLGDTVYLAGESRGGWGSPVDPYNGSLDAFALVIYNPELTPTIAGGPIPGVRILNPVCRERFLQIAFYGQPVGMFAMAAYTLDGKRAIHQKQNTTTTDWIWEIPIDNHAAGSYLAIITSPNREFRKRFVIIK
jgi:hypothetical protein